MLLPGMRRFTNSVSVPIIEVMVPCNWLLERTLCEDGQQNPSQSTESYRDLNVVRSAISVGSVPVRPALSSLLLVE